jgi:hypothetical protein
MLVTIHLDVRRLIMSRLILKAFRRARRCSMYPSTGPV